MRAQEYISFQFNDGSHVTMQGADWDDYDPGRPATGFIVEIRSEILDNVGSIFAAHKYNSGAVISRLQERHVFQIDEDAALASRPPLSVSPNTALS